MVTSELNQKPPAPQTPNEEDEGSIDAAPDSQFDSGDDTKMDTHDENEDESKANSSTRTMNDMQAARKTLTHEEYEEMLVSASNQ